jgi:hypothetical protein
MAAKKKPSDQELAARYGYAISFFKAYPELNRLLAKAKTHNWDAANFQAAIRNTSWWKTRSSSQRDYDVMKYTDPGQWKAKVGDSRTALVQQAAQMGVNLTPAQAELLSKQAVRDGLSQAELQKSLAQKWLKASAGGKKIDEAKGGASVVVGQLRELAAQMGYPLGDTTLAQQTYNVLAGNKDTNAIAEQYKAWAKKHFAGAADLIDAGQSVQDILDPYAQIASQELGIGRDQIQAADPKWQAALNQQGTMLSLTDWRTKIRTDSQYGWDSSQAAQQSAYQMVAGLSQMFNGG